MTENHAPVPQLPVEILERIIDYVHEFWYDTRGFTKLQYSTWKACALTCRAMRPRSQNWLFRRILLQSKYQAKSLKPILKENSLVAKNVQVLILQGPSDGDDARNNGWISWVPLMCAPLMVNLQELELCGDVLTNSHPQFFHAISAFRSISRLRLRRVRFSRFEQCTDLIRAFPNLRFLDLAHISWNPDPIHLQLAHGAEQTSSGTRRQIRIVHFNLWSDLSEENQICQWLLNAKTVRSLRTFSSHCFGFETLMNYEPSGGYHFRSVFFSVFGDISIAVPDSKLNSLQILHIHSWSGEFPIRALTSILSSTPRMLHEVTIYLETPTVHPNNLEKEISAYEELDTILSSAALKAIKMKVYLCGSEPSMETRDKWQQLLVSKLPTFCAREGNLAVVCSTAFADPERRWQDHRDGLYNLDE